LKLLILSGTDSGLELTYNPRLREKLTIGAAYHTMSLQESPTSADAGNTVGEIGFAVAVLEHWFLNPRLGQHLSIFTTIGHNTVNFIIFHQVVVRRFYSPTKNVSGFRTAEDICRINKHVEY
jgi:hypothetical protein